MHNFDTLGKKISMMHAVIETWIAKLGLTYNHYAVRYALAAADAENQPCTQKHISDEWLIPKQTVFNICKDYKEKGWITFSESTTDKRERLMHLTEAGRAQALPVWQATRQLGGNAIAQFGAEKTAQLFALMDEFCAVCEWQIARTTVDGEER